MVSCCKISVYQSIILRGFLIGTEGGRQGEWDAGRQGSGNFAMFGRVCVWFLAQLFHLSEGTENLQPIDMQHDPVWKPSYFFPWQDPWGLCCPEGGFFRVWAQVSYIFLKVCKICNWSIWSVIQPYLENLIFRPMGSSSGLFCSEGVFCWFWEYGSCMFLKVHKICNRLICYMTIFENFNFHPMGSPRETFFCPQGTMHRCCNNFMLCCNNFTVVINMSGCQLLHSREHLYIKKQEELIDDLL